MEMAIPITRWAVAAAMHRTAAPTGIDARRAVTADALCRARPRQEARYRAAEVGVVEWLIQRRLGGCDQAFGSAALAGLLATNMPKGHREFGMRLHRHRRAVGIENSRVRRECRMEYRRR